jgi:hypothetical protein
MNKICDNREFLLKLVESKPSQAKVLILNCNQEELECILELILNSITLIGDTDKLHSKLKVFLAYFKSKSVLSFKYVKKLLIKNQSTLRPLLATIVVKLIEEALVCSFVG